MVSFCRLCEWFLFEVDVRLCCDWLCKVGVCLCFATLVDDWCLNLMFDCVLPFLLMIGD